MIKQIIKRAVGCFNLELSRARTSPVLSTVSAKTPAVLVGTHHKTGTVWLLSIFQQISRETGRELIDLSRMTEAEVAEHLNRSASDICGKICLHDHSFFPVLKKHNVFRGMRMVRDPRDVVLSLRYAITKDLRRHGCTCPEQI
jgi:hypothetical protein